jgi:hypothetical protein
MATARRLTEEERATITEVEGMIDTLIRNDQKLTKAECLRKFLPTRLISKGGKLNGNQANQEENR